MNYFLIFVFKVLENSLATLRLILVSNGKKILGSILLFIISIIWIVSSSVAIIHINLIMILSFSVGSLIGSYIGSFLEEKLALGNNLVMCITNKNIEDDLRSMGYIITKIETTGLENNNNLLLIVIKRKFNKKLINSISLLDSKAIVISEYTNILYTK